MHPSTEDKELIAIQQIINALDSLEVEEKKRVLDYVFNRLGLKNFRVETQSDLSPSISVPSITREEVNADIRETARNFVDIRSFKDEKQPKSAIQMAVIVAYYLSELAPENERKETINSQDLVKYFKQAGFELPNAEPIYTLRNAKNAGYLESTGGNGEYKLNPVGHNLVAHRLPIDTSESQRPSRKKISKVTNRKKGK